MDPLSVTANAIAVVGITCKTCRSLYHFFRGLAEVSDDVRRICKTLQSLESVLSSIQLLHADAEIERYITREFKVCLEECMLDIRSVEARVRKADMLLQKGRLHRSWAQLKWSSTADHWLDKFFARVQTYHTVFSLELITLQV